MSEEEKEAIEDFRKLVKAFREARQEFGENEIKNYIQIEKVDVLETILNLIEKQQKEIEQLKQDKNKLINYIAIKEDLDFKQVVEKFELGDYK